MMLIIKLAKSAANRKPPSSDKNTLLIVDL